MALRAHRNSHDFKQIGTRTAVAHLKLTAAACYLDIVRRGAGT
jgi:hypothetical protein